MTCVYAAIVGAFVYRRLALRSIPKVLLASGLESAMIMLLLGLSEPFAWIVAADQIPQMMIDAIGSISTSPWVILFLVNVVLIIIGIPIETAPALVIVAPILAPMAAQLGIDPVHLGVVVCFNLVLGLVTPGRGRAVCRQRGLRALARKAERGDLEALLDRAVRPAADHLHPPAEHLPAPAAHARHPLAPSFSPLEYPDVIRDVQQENTLPDARILF